MAILLGGRLWSFCCCAAVFGVIVLKPEAASMLSLFCVLVCVLAQPSANANSAMALIILNAIRIFFIFFFPSRFAVVAQTLSQSAWACVYETLVPYVVRAGRSVCFKSNPLDFEHEHDYDHEPGGREDPPSPLTERLAGQSWMPSFAIASRISKVTFSFRAAKAA